MSHSANVVKLNALNEVSLQFSVRFFREIKDKKLRSCFPIINFLILNDQYEKILYGESAKSLPEEVQKIKNIKWYRQNVGKLHKSKKYLESFLDRKQILEYILWDRYCFHLNWKRFAIQSAFLYKCIIK